MTGAAAGGTRRGLARRFGWAALLAAVALAPASQCAIPSRSGFSHSDTGHSARNRRSTANRPGTSPSRCT